MSRSHFALNYLFGPYNSVTPALHTQIGGDARKSAASFHRWRIHYNLISRKARLRFAFMLTHACILAPARTVPCMYQISTCRCLMLGFCAVRNIAMSTSDLQADQHVASCLNGFELISSDVRLVHGGDCSSSLSDIKSQLFFRSVSSSL